MHRFNLSHHVVIAVFSLLCAFPLHAQELNWAQKMFSELKIDFGTVARGADVRYELIVENIYKENVSITNVGTTCGCSAAKPNKTKLATRETAIIEVVMDTKKFMRRKDSNVDVTLAFEGADGVATKKVRVPITAYIRSDVVLTPGNANFNGIYYGDTPSRTIDIAYAGRENWNIQDVRSKSEFVQTELKQLTRGAGRIDYQLVVTLKPGAPVGNFRDQIVLVTDDKSSPEVPILVEGSIKPDIVITPETLPLGELTPGSEKTVNVVVKGNRPFVIDDIVAESDRGCFKVQVPKMEKNLHMLPLKVTAPTEPGDLEEVFTVTIAGRSQPITFKAKGVVKGELTTLNQSP